MPHLPYYFLVLFILTFAVPMRAGTLDRFCKAAFSKIPLIPWSSPQLNLGKRLSSGKWLRDERISEALKTLQADYLREIRPGAEKYLGALPPGSVIQVSGVEHQVVSYLGSGFEGAVYLVDGPRGKKVVKKFSGHTTARANSNHLIQLAEQGVPTVRVWEVDDEKQTVLLDYVEGVPVNVLLERGSRYGLSSMDREGIQKHFLKFKKQVLPLLPTFKDSSVIMDLNTGEFVVVDPL